MEHETSEKDSFHEKLSWTIDDYVHGIYAVTRGFPKEELYGVTSQIRRAALSVAPNYVEGYARRRIKVNLNFLEISYGSLKESQYLLTFSFREGYLAEKDYKNLFSIGDEIARMLWGTLRKM